MARSHALLNVLKLSSSESLPIEQQFLNDLKASIELQDAKGLRKPSKTFKPSSMHCIRNMYFQVTGAEVAGDRASSELVGICESGSDRHERIQDAVMHMKDNNIDCEYVDVAKYIEDHRDIIPSIQIVSKQGNETKLYDPEYNVSFLCDGIIRYKGKYYILEIKTETANKFWDRKTVSEDHVLQGTAYSFLLGLDNVLFVYECRDTCNKKAFMFTPTQDQKESLKHKIVDCKGYAERMIPPPKPDDISRKACMYCGYAELCKKV